MRNIGISAHIDSGKTTLTERILYYTGRIDEMHEVRGKDGVGARMDSMELEREKGITIKSAATSVSWGEHAINVIDTPGHVDFTIEVERSLHVLDGAVLVVCGVNGVQSQTLTVDRQMKRYSVPRVVFVNKLDRLGADPWKALKGLRNKLGLNAHAMQVPMGVAAQHSGVIDLLTMRALYFEGEHGERIVEDDIPVRYQALAEEKREALLSAVADVDDGVAMALLEGETLSADALMAAVRQATIARTFVPLFMGSAYKNKGVQPLIDAVTRYLPSPLEVQYHAFDVSQDGAKVALANDASAPLVAYAFKLEEHKYGQLTWVRVYQGTLKKGAQLYNVQMGTRAKVPRLARMNAGDLEDITELRAGDIGAMFGVDCASGETFTDGSVKWQLTSMHVPAPVVSLAITSKSQGQNPNFTKALRRFTREDPTFRVERDADTGETLICGMGELHLEIYIERMRREYDLQVQVGRPRVNYRETITASADFDYTHKKQSGGAGQYAKIAGRVEPVGDDEGVVNEFVNSVIGNNIPPAYIPAVEKGFYDCIERGPLIGHPVERMRMLLLDGGYHSVDSSEYAFRQATHYAFKEAFLAAEPSLLEPVMSVEVTGPAEFQNSMQSTLNKRRGLIQNATIEGPQVVIEAEMPLANMFGYATELRSATEGKGEFAMEYKKHALVSRDRLDAIVADYRARNERDRQNAGK